MKKEFSLQPLNIYHSAPIDLDKPPKEFLPLPVVYYKAYILTGEHAAHLTGQYDPCLVFDNNIVLTKTDLLRYLTEMSEMEGTERMRR